MNLKTLFRWLCKKVYTYNVFIPEEDDYSDNDDQLEEPETVLRHQRYATRLYILLLMVFLYVLFYIALMRPQARTNMISSIDLRTFNQLYSEHNETLSCPCSNTTTSYRDFVFNKITFHPVCNSIFVTKPWIEALYFSNASKYLMPDFRKTAHAQFRLLSDLCSFSKESMFQNQLDLDNNEFITLYLLHRSQVQSEIDATIDTLENILTSRINAFLNYLRITTRANYLVSALNTNFLVQVLEAENSMRGGIVTFYQQSITEDNVNSYFPCSTENPNSSVYLSSNSSELAFYTHIWWERPAYNVSLVNGFYTGCTPFEALLPSTLDCLYDIVCLQLLSEYFPILKQMKLNFTNFVLPHSEKLNASINHFLLNLFVQNRTTNIDYPIYFEQCSASFCTYTATDQTNYSHAITLFISLYGGLIIILRLIAPFLIKISMKLKHHKRDSVPRHTNHWSEFLQWMKRLNLFKKKNDRSDEDIKQQRIITRVYLILLTGSIITLLLFNSINSQLLIINILNPSLNAYNDLQISHSDTLHCPCTSTNILYLKFVSLSPIFHQVCSSDFVAEQWLSILSQSNALQTDFDWRNRAYSHFQLLSNLCQFADQTVNDAIRRFLARSFVTSSALTQIDFDKQINATLDEFFQSTTIYFDLFIKTTRLLTQIDQPFMGSIYDTRDQRDPNLILRPIKRRPINSKIIQLGFHMYGTRDTNTTKINCICATSPNCQSPTALYIVDIVQLLGYPLQVEYVAPGFSTGCSPLESLLLSTLECSYSTSDCFSILMNYIKKIYFFNVEYPLWFDVRPLISNSTSSIQFPPNISISDIVNRIMIERWDLAISYEKFYQSCAPSHCSYSEITRTKTPFEVVITLVSMIGGFSLVLRLITPHLVRVSINLLKKRGRRQRQQGTCLVRMKMMMKNIIGLLCKTLMEFNIFPIRHFGNNVNQTIAKQLGRWTTRLYTLLLIIVSIIIILYTIVQPQTLTKRFEKPSFDSYNHLKEKYGDTLKCPCSSVSSMYKQFVNIQSQFHEVCSSEFVSDEWTGLVANLSVYAQRDYRRFISAHLQFLRGLCQLSTQSVNSSIEQFLSSLFITTQLLTEENFRDRLSSLINQTKSNAPITFNRLLTLTRIVNHGNAIVSTYGTNFEYTQHVDTSLAVANAIVYDNSCSCGLLSNCTTQANFVEENGMEMVPVKGMKMGCTPSESFRLSTLECFYDQTCLDDIRYYLQYSKLITPLNQTMKRFHMNTTVNELINDLFVEEWKVFMDYSIYFHQCLPMLCSYTYIEKFHLLYTITYLIGFLGGMSIVLKWTCPHITRFVFKIYQYRKKRITLTPVQPIVISHDVALPTRCSSKCVIVFTILMFVIIIVAIVSVFIARIEKKQQISTGLVSLTAIVNSTTVYSTTTTTITTSITNTPLPLCQATFRLISRVVDDYYFDDIYLLVGDFNNDNQLDIVYYSYSTDGIVALMGLGDGGFRQEIQLTSLDGVSIWEMDFGNFNGDSYLDLLAVCYTLNSIGILLGNGDGTFGAPTILYEGPLNLEIVLNVCDLNNDNQLDFIVLNLYFNHIAVFLGNGDGTFKEITALFTGFDSYLSSTAIGDFNNDNRLDIIVANKRSRYISVFLGHDNGSFESQIATFTGGSVNPIYIGVGDFNSDNHLDVVISYDSGGSIGMMFGQGNGSFSEIIKITTVPVNWPTPVVVIDSNDDSYLDIVFYRYESMTLDILLGDGKGHFQEQTLFSAEFSYYSPELLSGDFNGDGYQDIINVGFNPPTFNVLLNTCECCTTQ